MPQVPYSPVPDVSPQDIPAPKIRLQTNPDMFGANVGGAIRSLGSTEEQVGNELFSRAVGMQQLRNETDRTNAVAAYEMAANEEQVKFLSLRGSNAVNGLEGYRNTINDLRQQYRDSLPNDMARKMYDSSTLGIQNRLLVGAGGHAASENRTSFGNSLRAEIDAKKDSAAYARNDADFQDRLNDIDRSSRTFADFSGIDGAARDQLAFKDKSAAIASRIDQIARTDAPMARKMLDKAIADGTLHSIDRDRTETFVHSHLMSSGTRYFTEQNDKDFRDPETWLARRGNIRAQGVDPQFGQNMVAAGSAYERATGKQVQIESLVRTTEEQARIYAEHKAMPGGVEAHPAAQPGTSRHEFGRAADIDAGFAGWLKQTDSSGQTNASKYGLEFLPGKTGVNDPNHIQLAGDAPIRRVRTYDINERDYVNGAVGRLKAALPDAPPEMVDRTMQEASALYNKNAQFDRQEDTSNHNTILEALNRDNPPQTLSDLLKMGPEYQNAWNKLPEKDQKTLLRTIEKNPVTDQAEKFRLWGMAGHDETIPDFLKEDIQNNPKLSKSDKFALFQEQMKKARKATADANITWAMSQVRHLIPEDIRTDKEQMNLLRGALRDQMVLHESVFKTPLSGKDLQETAQRLINEPVTGKARPLRGFPYGIPDFFRGGSSGSPLFQTPVPSADYDQIKSDWVKQKGNTPTDAMISQVYIAQLYQKLYGRANKP